MRDADEARIARVVHFLGLATLIGVTPAVIHNLYAGRIASVVVLVMQPKHFTSSRKMSGDSTCSSLTSFCRE
jgi:hypothetical protein